jgi:Zn-dependent metalloprotease
MKIRLSLLTLSIASGLAVAAPVAEAAGADGAAKAAAANRALALIKGSPAATRNSGADAFIAGDVTIDANGTEHVRFARTYGGLPVIGGDVVVHSRSGALREVSQTLKSTARPGLAPVVRRDEAIVTAGARFGTGFTGSPSSRLVIYARDTAPLLAHEVVYHGFKADQTPTEMHYIVDARTGKIIDQWDMVHTAMVPGPGGTTCAGTAATGRGASLTLGNVPVGTAKCGSQYVLNDTTRGGGATHNMAMKTGGLGTVFTDPDNAWGNGLTSHTQTAAVDAHYGVAQTWDYFKNTHGRVGIANDGVGVISRVHYGRNYANAFWSEACNCMTFGDGTMGATIYPMVVIDVAGHEMTHGVTNRTAKLIYSGESGGLNEATSDIFGTMVEHFSANAADTADYVIGEKLYPNNASMRSAIRWMFKPSLDGASPDCWSSSVAGLDVHYSSGPANRFYYLLAEGATVPAGFGAGSWANLTPASLVCNGNTSLTGIGRTAASKIWYRALTVYMTSSTNYAGARAATLSAATDLYGAGSTQAKAVAAAWAAVNVN